MNRYLSSISQAIVCVSVVLSCMVVVPARAQIRIKIFPPSWLIATTKPVYHMGRAAYWYRNRWYYRHGREWRFYKKEPGPLRIYRERRAGSKHFYGRRHGGGYRHHRR